MSGSNVEVEKAKTDRERWVGNARGVPSRNATSSPKHRLQLGTHFSFRERPPDRTQVPRRLPPELELLGLIESTGEHFGNKRLKHYATAMWVKTEHKPICSIEHLDQFNQFTSVLTLRFRVLK